MQAKWLQWGGTGVSHKGPLNTTEADFAISLLYVSQILFHLVLDHVVFSLAIPIPRWNGQKCLEPSPGIGN